MCHVSCVCPDSNPSMSTGGDMLDYLVHSGNISKPDGLYATWFHRANNKEQMNSALRSKCTLNILSEYLNIVLKHSLLLWRLHSDKALPHSPKAMLWSWRLMSLWRVITHLLWNQYLSWPTHLMSIVTTLWTNGWMLCWPLEKVLLRRTDLISFFLLYLVFLNGFNALCVPAAMKLDFKSLESVGLSLDVLNKKNSHRRIDRPVWLNADIVQGPNVPAFVPPVNGTRWKRYIYMAHLDAQAVISYLWSAWPCISSREQRY